MDIIDKEKADRVWQRVTAAGPAGDNTQELETLITQKWADASTYLHLSRRFQGKESGVLRRLSEQSQAQTACLKGIYTLLTGNHPVVRTMPAEQEPVEQTLRRCYGREMHCLARYEAKTADPEFGQVFSRLAEQEKDHCRTVLELIGTLKRSR